MTRDQVSRIRDSHRRGPQTRGSDRARERPERHRAEVKNSDEPSPRGELGQVKFRDQLEAWAKPIVDRSMMATKIEQPGQRQHAPGHGPQQLTIILAIARPAPRHGQARASLAAVRKPALRWRSSAASAILARSSGGAQIHQPAAREGWFRRRIRSRRTGTPHARSGAAESHFGRRLARKQRCSPLGIAAGAAARCSGDFQ